MKRKWMCALLAVIMVISLMPTMALNASAASTLTTSEDGIALIKSFEGFSASAYWDNTQWSIGYGTVSSQGATITQADADTALRSALATIDSKINEFTAANNLTLTQNQHDALASLCYNCGTGWLSGSGRLKQAILQGKTGNDFLFAISLWANISSVPNAKLIQRRLCEANLYINGVYSKTVPSNWSYVIYDSNGGTPGNSGEDKMQGFCTDSAVSIMVEDPTRSGYTFAGWYTSASGGDKVETLTSSVAGKTLYAHWMDANGNIVYDEVIATGTVKCSTSVNIRSGAGTGYSVTGYAYNGDTVKIYEKTTVNGQTWGRIDGGWICLDYVSLDSSASATSTSTSTNLWGETTTTTTTTTTQTGTVTGNYVNVRSGAGTNYSRVSQLNKGATVTIYETTTVGSTSWGRIGTNQWICMNYVQLSTDSSSSSDSSTTTSGQTGKVSCNTNLRVRSGAGTSYTATGYLTPGTSVTIYETTTVNGVQWGRIGTNQWVCMTYVTLDSSSSSSSSSGTTSSDNQTGTVTTALNVRSGAGTQYAKMGTLSKGDTVTIYETKTVGSAKWGRIGTNRWINLSYVNLSGTSSNTTNTTTNTTTTTTQTGKVSSKTNLRIRSGAGTSYTATGYLTPGSSVTIYETTTVNGVQWGRIGTNQWVCMTYVTLDSGTTISTTTQTGTVTTQSTALNVRSGAGTNYAIVGTVAKGATVTVYEQKTVGSTTWGRIGTNQWVSMSYITLSSSSSSSSSLWN